MSIQSVSSVSFKANNNMAQRQKGGAGKAIASFFIPGLGEFLDGRNKEGAIFLGSRLGVSALGGLLASKQYSNLMNFAMDNIDAKQLKTYTVPAAILGAASLGLTIANVVDAYKGGSDKNVDVMA